VRDRLIARKTAVINQIRAFLTLPPQNVALSKLL
jgi:hypothetical protein